MTHYTKFPRTWHLPWSPGMSSDDKMMSGTKVFEGQRVIATKKMDGENTSCYHDYYTHARSLENEFHESRTWVKNWWAHRAADLPEFWKIVVENLYAKHSIAYTDLPDLALGFHVWNDRGVCLGWDDTLDYFGLLRIHPVEVLYDGIYDEKAIRAIERSLSPTLDEGYVLRLAGEIPFDDYRRCVGKFVRKNHVQSAEHWKSQAVVKNLIRGTEGPR